MTNHLTLHFVTPEMLKAAVITAKYDPILVLASVFTAVFASYISFLLSARIKGAQLKNEKLFWTLLSSCFLGAGIWAMHFVGMLAYQLPIPVRYNIPITLVSILPSIFASYFVISPNLERFKHLWFRSVFMGLGIGSMHYVGMIAMIMPAHMAYEPTLFTFSVFIAVALSGLALKINELRQTTQNKQKRVNFLAALVMGSAISGMHYIGMLSMYVFESSHTTYLANDNSAQLAQVIIFVVLVLSLFLVGSMELRARSLLSAKLKAVLNTVQDVVICFDRQGIIEFANPPTTKVFGFDQQALIGKNIAILLPKKHAKFYHSFNEDQSNFGKSQLLQGCKNCGQEFPITIAINPISELTNAPLVATIKDLTDIQNQEAFTQTIFDTLPNILFIKEAKHLSYSHVNKSAEKLLGKSQEQLIGLNDFDIFPAEQAKFFAKADRKVLNSNNSITINEEPVTINGATRYLRTHKVIIKDNMGKAKFLLGISEDITELREARIELDNLHHRIALAADAANIGIWEWNFKTDVLIWDDWMHTLYGIKKGTFSCNYAQWSKTIHPDDYDDVTNRLAKAIATNEKFHAEFKIILPCGATRYINADGRVYGDSIVGINFDISKRIIAEKEVLKLAQTDYLTGLANRNTLTKFAECEFGKAKQANSKVACLYFDLDKLKPINDTHGHIVGDCVLTVIADRLKDITRKTDCIARIGGDEFVVISTNIESLNQIEKQITRYLSAIELPIVLQHNELLVTVSIGYAIYPDEAADLDELLNKADKRMYEHKSKKHDHANNSQPQVNLS
ncbi:diguanylate cyclase domain-containing protein [Pseudoalteromonas translucida]|uniref:GGDEF sensory box protein n=1 Tax=Pseudoalteromonas translucida (strain TAC 125) TaxID=326442 RepID=Q3ICD3_PSET1|nr:diguanylate cyclase [Pseudoalteromonas translucida]CAI89521.1 putative GGDEF sensory box protein [Pseudoalteromonas translucida]